MLPSPSCLCCLPGRPLLFAGLRLPASPRASLCLVLPACLVVPCPGWCFWLPSFVVLVWLVGVACFLLRWVGLASLCGGGFVLFFFILAPRVCCLCPTLVWTGTFVYFAFTCTTKALIDHCTCVFCPLTGQLHLYC